MAKSYLAFIFLLAIMGIFKIILFFILNFNFKNFKNSNSNQKWKNSFIFILIKNLLLFLNF